ncbi:MAG TPA: SpoIVB peptidase S55 domain-containing protein [Vicinamibacteria bacterium]|nr:SpoIVB peptidase S55 domain-containing protein [Vicinamibacteria bacterium]HRB12556.1 SpoIVB peptidase S55 domain-containing protein [Vicinamibacteria bacterium]
MLRIATGLMALAAAANPAAPQATVNTSAAAATLARVPSDVPIFPLEDVKPGMRGVGRTVFANQKLETFEVEIIGALENSAPRQTMIMARLTGGPLANTGVIAGMSGSPVYIDGKLLGAVAFGFGFSKEAIAGITPYAEMTGFSRMNDILLRASASPESDILRPIPLRMSGLPLPIDAATLISKFTSALDAVGTNAKSSAGVAGLSPLPIPLSVSGLSGSAFDVARGLFSKMGFTPLQVPAKGVAPGPLPPLEAGGPVAVSLIQGDFDFSATGTVTHIDKDAVYAFGHPFFGIGPIDFPMRRAWVYDVFPSLNQSFKIASAHDTIGRFQQDRATGISGKLGAGPRMIPVKVSLQNRPGQKQDYSFSVVQDDLFTPLTVYASVLSVLQGQERVAGPSTVTLDATVNFTSIPALRLQDQFADGQPGAMAAGLVGSAISFVMNNEFRRVSLESVTVNLTAKEAQETAVIDRAWLERDGPVRPGATVPMKVALRTFRGEEVVVAIPVEVPLGTAPGRYAIFVSDGAGLSQAEQREMRQAFIPRNLDQIVRAVNSIRKSTQIYVRLQRFEEGAAVSGTLLPGLPPSMMQVLGASEGGEPVVRTATTVVWDGEKAVDFSVRGARFLALQIER